MLRITDFGGSKEGHMIRHLILIAVIALVGCKNAETNQAPQKALAPSPAGPVIVRIVSRDTMITARAGNGSGPVYSQETAQGEKIVPAMSLQQLQAQHPDLATQVKMMQAGAIADIPHTWAGAD